MLPGLAEGDRAAATRLRVFLERRIKELSKKEQRLVQRARKRQRFLTHPIAMPNLQRPADRYVSIEDTISWSWQYWMASSDDTDEMKLHFIGGLDELKAD